MKKTTGRPTIYKEEYNASADQYLLENQDVPTEGGREDVNLPTIEGFARYLDVNKTTLYEWDKKYPAFSNSLSKIKHEQQRRLLNKGLSGQYNSTIAKLILSSNHGMSDKVVSELTGKDGGAIVVNSVKELSDEELLNLAGSK